MKLMYFAWVREKIGISEEFRDLPDTVSNVSDLIDWLKLQGEGYAEALSEEMVVRVAVNHEYVTLDNTIPPISDLLCELASVVQPYGMENYVSVVQDDFIWNTNWKILTENFMEGYHLPVVHKKTVGNWFATNKTCFPSNRSVSFTFQTFSKNPDAIYGGAHPMNKRLIGEQRQTSIMPTVFPAHMYVLAPDHLWYLALNPLGVGQLGIRFGIALAPEVNNNIQDRKKFISELNTFFDKVNAEDKKIVESIFESTKAPLAKPGPLSWLEREIHDLIFYLSKRLEYKNEGAKN